MAESLNLAIKPVSRRPSFKADMQPLVSVRQSLDRPLDRQRTVLDIAEKSDLPGPAAFRDRHGVLLLRDVKSDKSFDIPSHGPPSVHEAPLGLPEQPSFLAARKGGPPAQPANMTSRLCAAAQRYRRARRRQFSDRSRQFSRRAAGEHNGYWRLPARSRQIGGAFPRLSRHLSEATGPAIFAVALVSRPVATRACRTLTLIVDRAEISDLSLTFTRT